MRSTISRLPKSAGRATTRIVGTRLYADAASLPSYLVNTPETKITTLPNNIRVATEEGFGETASVGVFINTGSRYEDKKNNGVAHFLEHMTFKGTDRRSRKDIELEIENMGGHLNAYTSREQTVFYARSFKKDIPKTMDILADVLQNSKLTSEDIERERSVIIRESEEVNKIEEECIFDHLHSVAYQESPLGYTILGPIENIKSIQRDDITAYIKKHYTGPRMVIAASGAVKHDEIVKLATDAFGSIPSKDSFDWNGQAKADFFGSSVLIRNDHLPVANVAVAFKGVSWTDPRYFTFMVMQAIIGSWNRTQGSGKNVVSRLADVIATEDLCHSFNAFNTCYNDTGLFGVYYVVPPGDHKIEDVSYEIMKEIVRQSVEVTDKEVERAKNRLKASILMNLDGSDRVLEDIGRQMLTLGRRMSAAEMFMRIDAITADTVRSVAKDKLYDTDPAIAAMGPIIELPDYNQFRSWTYWNRM